MLFMVDEIMTSREACDRWGITQEALRMKLKRSKDCELVYKMIRDGKLKYYIQIDKKRGQWILTVEAKKILFSQSNRSFIKK
ncbi:MarR family transcriptional regulator [Bacillus anthracis]|uniref:MarR family transcriptional regulator n=1 Tax=Bacillus anthracis TaxID=1392 RepID=UPI0028409207|nr:MarR family transcriptional regulator [Bacillus anthracis]MDR4384635.1 MarR family transcriptional regulator [Bacillus anthracis]